MSDDFTRETANLLIDDWIAMYPTDIFPPLKPEERGLEVSRDRVSAHAIRHAMARLREDVAGWGVEDEASS